MSTQSNTARVRELIRTPFFWGIVAILALLALNVIKDPSYLALTINETNGNVVGNLVDILRASAPILMIAVGMSLVIATGGIDLSVGSASTIHQHSDHDVGGSRNRQSHHERSKHIRIK